MGFDISYTYDGAGNRLTMTSGTDVTTYTYSNANRIQTANLNGAVTTYTHDGSGNLIKKQDASSLTTYAWDAACRMVQAELDSGIVTMTYNGLNQRVSKQSTDGSTLQYLYDYKNLLKEADGGGDTLTTYQTTEEEFEDLISEFDETTSQEFYHQFDAQHATNAMLDDSGSVTQQMKYQAFGLPESTGQLGWANVGVDDWANMGVNDWATLPVNPATRMSWGGQKQYYYDPELELYFLGMGADGRHYDPAIGRFTKEDPIRYAGGQLNLSVYVGNDPINKDDASGHGANQTAQDLEYDLWDLERENEQVLKSRLAKLETQKNVAHDAGNISEEQDLWEQVVHTKQQQENGFNERLAPMIKVPQIEPSKPVQAVNEGWLVENGKWGMTVEDTKRLLLDKIKSSTSPEMPLILLTLPEALQSIFDRGAKANTIDELRGIQGTLNPWRGELQDKIKLYTDPSNRFRDPEGFKLSLMQLYLTQLTVIDLHIARSIRDIDANTPETNDQYFKRIGNEAPDHLVSVFLNPFREVWGPWLVTNMVRHAFDEARAGLTKEAATASDPLGRYAANTAYYFTYVGQASTDYALMETGGAPFRLAGEAFPVLAQFGRRAAPTLIKGGTALKATQIALWSTDKKLRDSLNFDDFFELGVGLYSWESLESSSDSLLEEMLSGPRPGMGLPSGLPIDDIHSFGAMRNYDYPIAYTRNGTSGWVRTVTPWQRVVIEQPGMIDWELIRPKEAELPGIKNIDAARKGYAPGRINPATGKWDRVVLHHALDDPRGAVIQAWESDHTAYHNIIGRDANDFNEFLWQSQSWRDIRPDWANAWRNEVPAYWQWRSGKTNPPVQNKLWLPGDQR